MCPIRSLFWKNPTAVKLESIFSWHELIRVKSADQQLETVQWHRDSSHNCSQFEQRKQWSFHSAVTRNYSSNQRFVFQLRKKHTWKPNKSCLFILNLVSSEGVICVAVAGAEEVVEGRRRRARTVRCLQASVYGQDVWAELQIHEERQERRKPSNFGLTSSSPVGSDNTGKPSLPPCISELLAPMTLTPVQRLSFLKPLTSRH